MVTQRIQRCSICSSGSCEPTVRHPHPSGRQLSEKPSECWGVRGAARAWCTAGGNARRRGHLARQDGGSLKSKNRTRSPIPLLDGSSKQCRKEKKTGSRSSKTFAHPGALWHGSQQPEADATHVPPAPPPAESHSALKGRKR